MRFKSLLAITALSAATILSGCYPPEKPAAHSTKTAVHVRHVRNTDDNSLIYWYIIYSHAMSNSCPCYVASSSTLSNNTSALSFSKLASVPAAAGNSPSTKVEEEQTEEEANENLPEDIQSEVEQSETAENTETESNESSSNDSGSDTSSSGGDSGGGDSGGGDSGGGE
jgi:uncharacterized membrane protein YgcG